MESIYQTEKKYIGETMEGREGFVLKDAYGSTLVDENGKEFIDFTSGWNVMNLGWKRPEIVEAMSEQLKHFPYSPMWCSTESTAEYAQKLSALLPKNLNTFFKATGGTEATEIALKIARAYTGKKKFLSFYMEYHGQTHGALSLGNTAGSTRAFEPLLPGFVRVHTPNPYRNAYGDNISSEEASNRALAIIRKTIELEGDVAAFVCETLQTCPGVVALHQDFFKGLRKICDDYGVLMIIDEVGTGFGRTGKMFAFEHYGFVPDMVTFAKAISAGYGPMGAVACSREMADVMKGKGGTSTFGWHTLSVVSALKSLEIIEKENLVTRAKEMGEYFMQKLHSELDDIALVGDIRGMGLEIGVELVKDRNTKEAHREAVDAVVRGCMADGLHIVWSGRTTTLMIMPPLVITKEEADKGLDSMIKHIKLACSRR